ncbi:MAG TPA: cation acetate symporter, partial [Hyphomonas atlantica]|nr:cation acetate symporter [Hyphomonas atlantica]
MDFWTYFWVVGTFGTYIAIALWARAGSTNDFYVAGHDVHPTVNGMATAADWMSAASFLSMAGLIAFLGYGGSVYLMGWTGGFVLLALLLAPFLREFGKFTVPDFVGDRYYSTAARLIAVICALFVSFTYIAGQMKGVGVAFSGFLGVEFNTGIMVGMAIVFVYAVLGGMKGITYTQVAQYCVMIFAYTVPAIFISLIITGNPVPQLGFISNVRGEDVAMLEKLNTVVQDLGFQEYTQTNKTMIDMFAITGALMFGTAGVPPVIIRFFTLSRPPAA